MGWIYSIINIIVDRIIGRRFVLSVNSSRCAINECISSTGIRAESILTFTITMNNSNGYNYSHDDQLLAISICLMVFSTLIFLASIVIVPAAKLHRFLVYRLALYQVVSVMLFNIIWFLFLLISSYLQIFNNISNSKYKIVFNIFLSSASSSALLSFMLTMWVTIHLFALSVLHRNLKKFELVYLVSSILVAIIIFIIVLSTSSKAPGQLDNYHPIQIVELIIGSFSLLIILLVSTLVIIMGVTLCCRACKCKCSGISYHGTQHKNLLYEMLPLLVYPILLLILVIPILYAAIDFSLPNERSSDEIATLVISSIVGSSLWSTACSCTLVIHVAIVLYTKKTRKQDINFSTLNTKDRVTMRETSALVKSETHYSLPVED